MILRRWGVPERMIDVLKQLHEDAEFYVSYAGKQSSTFKNERGFKEGSPDSPTLFLCL